MFTDHAQSLEAANDWGGYVENQMVLRGTGGVLLGTEREMFSNTAARLYVKNDNDAMIALERSGVNHVFEFRVGEDGEMVLGKRSGQNS